jgi:hypothetical protein
MAKGDWGSKQLPSTPCQWTERHTRTLYEKLGGTRSGLPKNKHGRFRVDGWDVIVKRSSSGSAKSRVFVEVDGQTANVGNIRQKFCKQERFQQQRKGRRLSSRQRRNAKGQFSWK